MKLGKSGLLQASANLEGSGNCERQSFHKAGSTVL